MAGIKGKSGGTRENAGRKPLTEEQRMERLVAKQTDILNELLIPAFVATQGGKLPVSVSVNALKDTYGKLGLDVWKLWFKQGALVKSPEFGTCDSTWELKLNMMLAAQNLIKHNAPRDPIFPPASLQEITHKKHHAAFWKKQQAFAKQFAKDGAEIMPPSPITPFELIDPKYNESRDNTNVWVEMMVNTESRFCEKSDGVTIPSNLTDDDVPY